MFVKHVSNNNLFSSYLHDYINFSVILSMSDQLRSIVHRDTVLEMVDDTRKDGRITTMYPRTIYTSPATLEERRHENTAASGCPRFPRFTGPPSLSPFRRWPTLALYKKSANPVQSAP